MHFRNLKHHNLSRLILRQSITPPPQPARVWTSASARTVPAVCGSDDPAADAGCMVSGCHAGDVDSEQC